ncbi:Uncharacterised protein [Mycobacterium tuberculosis]|nr:Uncharacterised protein [Mycobacterium tuberculosis]
MSRCEGVKIENPSANAHLSLVFNPFHPFISQLDHAAYQLVQFYGLTHFNAELSLDDGLPAWKQSAHARIGHNHDAAEISSQTAQRIDALCQQLGACDSRLSCKQLLGREQKHPVTRQQLG